MSVKKISLCLCLLSTVFLSGCWDAVEIDQQAYVINMALDKSGDDILVTIEMPSMNSSGVSASGGNEGDESENGDTGGSGGGRESEADKIAKSMLQDGYLLAQAKSATLYGAMNILETSAPRRLSYADLQNIMISEELAAMPQLFTILSHLRNFAGLSEAAQVIVCVGEAGEFLKKQQVNIGTRLTKSIKAMLEGYISQGSIPSATLDGVTRELFSFYNDPLVTLAALNYFEMKPEKQQRPGGYYAGEIPRVGTSLTEYFGSAVLMAGSIYKFTGYETQLISIVNGDYSKSVFAVPTEDNCEMLIYQRLKPYISIDTGEIPHISLSISLQVSPENIFSSGVFDEDEILRAMAKTIELDMLTLIKKCQENGADPFGFAANAVRNFSTVQNWEAYNWKDKYINADITVSVSLEMRNKQI